MKDKVQKIRESIEKRYEYWKEKEFNTHSIESEIRMSECHHLLFMLDSLQEEPVSNPIDFEQELYKAFGQIKDFTLGMRIAKRFYDMGSKAGAKWQFDQLEKNRLAHCDEQKEEEAEIERNFVMSVIENEHRQPTFDDAIKYGMKLREGQMMVNAVETTFNVSLSSGLYDKLWIKGCKEGDKLLVIKKDEL